MSEDDWLIRVAPETEPKIPSDPKLDEILKRLKGRPVILSVSGGKDSTATALYLRELDIPFVAIHMDTGWEHEDTEKYVREDLPKILGQKIEIVTSLPKLDEEREAIAADLETRFLKGKPSAFVRWMLKKGMFSSRKHRYCTAVLKVQPFNQWALETYGTAFVSAVGVRAEESAQRAALPEWDMSDEGYPVWRPLIAWTEQQVIDIHHRHDVPPNPLYTRGAARVGCYPCIMCRKAELRQVAKTAPDRIQLIRELEAAITKIVRKRWEDQGESFTLADGKTAKFNTFFANPNNKRQIRKKVEEAPVDLSPAAAQIWAQARVPYNARIDDVVAWSRTNRKGEPEPFAPLPHETGCARWGFCDLAWRNDAWGSEEEAKHAFPNVPPGGYRVIVADPPWSFRDSLTMSKVRRGSSSQYAVLDSEAVLAMGDAVQQVAADDSILVLWVVASQLQLGLDVLAAWGFTHKQVISWNKQTKTGLPAFGMGWTFRASSEFALVGTRGKMKAYRKDGKQRNRIDSIARGHTTKPEELQDALERMYPGEPAIELFARRTRKNWMCLGIECPGDGRDIRDSLRMIGERMGARHE